MATFRRWNRWIKMIFGKSDLHVNQPKGSFISKECINGYYNDFSNKVLFDKSYIDQIDYVPTFIDDNGKKIKFPIQIIQYALGCYELFLKTKKQCYLDKMLFCADYINSIIKEDGSIPCMFFVKELNNPFSAMCQGEFISLMARAYKETKKQIYFDNAGKAYSFLTNPEHPFAVAKQYKNLKMCLYEYPDKPIVLNGFIFGLFGLYDYFLLTNDENAKKYFELSKDSLLCLINDFSYGEWSFYDLGGNYSSSFYHKLHVELLSALCEIGCDEFLEYKVTWSKGLDNKKLVRKMFWKKAAQKI